MQFIIMSVLALAALAISSPLGAVAKRQTTCVAPASFEIHSFEYFTPAATNPGNSSMSFLYADNMNISATCTGTVAHGLPLSDPSAVHNCSNSAVTFTWTGTTLMMKETVACLNK